MAAFRSSPSSQLLATFLLMAILISPMLVQQSDAARTSRKLLCALCSMGPISAMIPQFKPISMPMVGPQSGGWNWSFGWSCQKIKVGFFWTVACGIDKHKGMGAGPMTGGVGGMTGGAGSGMTGGGSSSTASSSSSSP